MSGFSADWLRLREPIDHASRSQTVDHALSARFAQRNDVCVLDLGCGTGSNLRATAPLLGVKQNWLLIDHDEALLAAAKNELAQWADEAEPSGDALVLKKSGKHVTVSFAQHDLSAGIGGVIAKASTQPDLITSAAFFDLVSEKFIRELARDVTNLGTAFHTSLTYNGIQTWDPRHFADNAVRAAFHQHQAGDKGFGPAAGPSAPGFLADQFRMHDYTVIEGDSPWRLTAERHEDLLGELMAGYIKAAEDIGGVDEKTLAGWSARRLKSGQVGHTDTLAVPG